MLNIKYPIRAAKAACPGAFLARDNGKPTTKTISICVNITQPPDSITDQNLNQNVCCSAKPPMMVGFLNNVANPKTIPKKANIKTGTIIALPNRLIAFIFEYLPLPLIMITNICLSLLLFI